MTSDYALESNAWNGPEQPHGDEPEPLSEAEIEAILDAEWPESDQYTDAELDELEAQFLARAA